MQRSFDSPFPGQWHTYHPYRQTGWNEYYIGFEGPVIDNLMKMVSCLKITRYLRLV